MNENVGAESGEKVDYPWVANPEKFPWIDGGLNVIWTGRNSDGRSEEFDSLEDAEAFASSGESLEWGVIGVFGYDPDNPCCEGPCTHEVTMAPYRAAYRAANHS